MLGKISSFWPNHQIFLETTTRSPCQGPPHALTVTALPKDVTCLTLPAGQNNWLVHCPAVSSSTTNNKAITKQFSYGAIVSLFQHYLDKFENAAEQHIQIPSIPLLISQRMEVEKYKVFQWSLLTIRLMNSLFSKIDCLLFENNIYLFRSLAGKVGRTKQESLEESAKLKENTDSFRTTYNLTK